MVYINIDVKEVYMSSVKCISLMTGIGAASIGGMGLYQGNKVRQKQIQVAEQIAKTNQGKIPTGGMTKDGKLWDGFTTVDQVKKDTKKQVGFYAAVNAIKGAAVFGAISGLTLLAKAKLFK